MKFPALILFFIILISHGCEKSTDWDLSNEEMTNAVVINAILTDETRFQEIRLSQPVASLDDEIMGIKEAKVEVSAGGLTYLFDHTPNEPGLYKSRDSFSINSQLQYNLDIKWNDRVIRASNYLAPVAPIPPIHFEKIDSLALYRIPRNVVPQFSDNQQAMYQFDVDWSHISGDTTSKARVFYYTFNSVHISQFVQISREDILFPVGTEVVVTKYGVEDEFGEFLRSQNIETHWNGIIFYGNPDNAISNIEGAETFGYFATCAIVRDTLIVN